MQVDMLKVFDVASPNECLQRSESVVPQQALAVSNSALSFDMSRVLASALSPPSLSPPPALAGVPAGAPGAIRDFVRTAFERVLGRLPSADEVKAGLEYLQSQAELYANSAGLQRFDTGARSRVQPAADSAQRARESRACSSQP